MRLFILLFFWAVAAFGQIQTQLTVNQIATGASAVVYPGITFIAFQAAGATTAGSGAATVKIQGTNVLAPTGDGDWVDLGTITLVLGTTRTGDGISTAAPWRLVRSDITAISGTNASVTVTMAANR